jgi:CRP-like cAMP-binding protein
LANGESANEKWLPVIGRALAYLCLKASQSEQMSIADKAHLLEAIGVDRKDVAEMLGTTYASVSELLRLARNKKRGGKSGGKTKKHR